jgi:hypothetical protein
MEVGGSPHINKRPMLRGDAMAPRVGAAGHRLVLDAVEEAQGVATAAEPSKLVERHLGPAEGSGFFYD